VVVLDGVDNIIVIGEVTGVHLRDDCLTAGRVDISRFGLVARLGYKDYATLRSTFAMDRPEGA
jgi:flavin reductase (DIM6/NTAB) family NADH-FMN oxidoreductase RutF